ncbi:MAG: rsbU 6 [Bacteroidetes bacterium]|nr:rsbU 6 [Bacteroidota bacterium]
MLVGTLAGVNFFNPVTQAITPLSKNLRVKINCLSMYDKDNVLVGTEEGLFILNVNTKGIKTISLPEIKINITAIFVNNGNAYIGTFENGLWVYSNGRFTQAALNGQEYGDFKVDELNHITEIKQYGGKLYIGTFGNGIFKLDNNFDIEKKIRFDRGDENANFVNSFTITDNRIYLGTNLGFIIYNLITNEQTTHVKNETEVSPLNNNKIKFVFIDKEENIWLGTDLGGINVTYKQSLKFPTSTLSYESTFENIYSFYEERKDLVWLGGVKTLHVLNTSTGKFTDYSRLLESNTALCIAKESENVFWIGTWGEGLIRFDRQTGKSKKFLSKEFGGTILCLKIDGNHIYAGSVGDGLFRVDLKSSEVKNFGVKDGLPNPSINTIFSDSKKNVWIGTYDGGLVKMKGFSEGDKLPILSKFKNEGKLGQLASNVVLGINEDQNGVIWVATSNGLSKLLPDNSFYNFYEKDGLSNTYMYSIMKDSVNYFWMSTNSGVIRFNPALSEKEIIFKNYSIKDGLVNKEYNMGAAFSSPSGNMYFGGAKGFNVFRPTAIRENLHAPQAYIVSYKRGGSDIETDSLITYKKVLKLSWRENYFQFEVVALDYTDPSKNKFKYKLEGYDKDWSAPTNVRYISYTELPGGEYTFKVKAANNDGIWNETPYEIHITVVPPFWKTKWFYVLVVLFSGAGIYAFTRYRTNAIRKENKILENKVSERTKELAEKNRDITSSIEYAKRIQEAILPSKDYIISSFEKAFILYKPKDIVSGDFYWFGEKLGVKIFAVVDCTGHGVPGAFMSMIGHNLLHQIIQEKGTIDPGEILNNLHKGVQEALRQGQNEIQTNDGMDVSIIAINNSTGEVKWAGANRPLLLINIQGVMEKYDGNKYPVGGVQIDASRFFTTHTVKKDGPTMAYMFTDGYADQFGGDKGKKFMVKRFHDLLLSIYDKGTEEQKRELERSLEQWRQNHEQVDDVLVVGIAI